MIKATIILGEDAVMRYNETGEIPTDKWLMDNGGVVDAIDFSTKAEHDAYMQALSDAHGWNDYHVIKDSETPDALFRKGDIVCLTDEAIQTVREKVGEQSAAYRKAMILEVKDMKYDAEAGMWIVSVMDIREDDEQEFPADRLRPVSAMDIRASLIENEPKVFLFPIDRFERNATNAEIIAGLDNDEDHESHIEIMTPDELAATLNDDDAGFSEQWVRFIKY